MFLFLLLLLLLVFILFVWSSNTCKIENTYSADFNQIDMTHFNIEQYVKVHIVYKVNPNKFLVNVLDIEKEINNYLTNYKNQTDYWEIVNYNLGNYLKQKFKFKEVKLVLEILPNTDVDFTRRATYTYEC